VVSLAETEAIPGEILPYLNRLSDYLFVVARFITHQLGGIESPWMPAR
jgi:cob(I)alamin adenosyltransferase